MPAYPTATATPDLSHVCDLDHSSRQHRILNPLSKARDRTPILMDTSQICFYCGTMGTPILFLFLFAQLLCIFYYLFSKGCNIPVKQLRKNSPKSQAQQTSPFPLPFPPNPRFLSRDFGSSCSNVDLHPGLLHSCHSGTFFHYPLGISVVS